MARRGDELIVISWRDIPAQVTANQSGRRIRVQLPRRFQRAIDDAAMRAGKKTASEYVGEWRRESRPLPPGADAQAAVDALVAAFDGEFTREVLARYVAALGFRPDGPADDG